jgi:hypothetical protein
MKIFFEELTKIETEHPDFFEKSHISISKYIHTLTNPAMVSFSTSMGRNYPLPKEIKSKIDALISQPRLLSNGRTKPKKHKTSNQPKE